MSLRLPRLVGCLALLAGFLDIALRVVYSQSYADTDFFHFWLAGRFALDGRDPYDTVQWVAAHAQYGAAWVPAPVFVYPLPMAMFLAPLGLLPLDLAFVAWAFLSLIMLVAAVHLAVGQGRLPAHAAYALPVLAGLLFFRPTFLSLLLGQVDPAFVLLLAAVLALWRRRSWLLGGCLLGVLMLKPQIGAPIILLQFLWLLLGRRLAAIAGLAVTAAGLLALGQLQDSGWIAFFLGRGGAKIAESFNHSPTVWGLAHLACGWEPACSTGLGAVAAAAVVLLGLFVMCRGWSDPSPVLGASVAAALLVTPYVWAYDQVLLVVPIGALAGQWIAQRRPYLAVAALFPAMAALAALALAAAQATALDVWSSLVPAAVLALLAAQPAAARR